MINQLFNHFFRLFSNLNSHKYSCAYFEDEVHFLQDYEITKYLGYNTPELKCFREDRESIPINTDGHFDCDAINGKDEILGLYQSITGKLVYIVERLENPLTDLEISHFITQYNNRSHKQTVKDSVQRSLFNGKTTETYGGTTINICNTSYIRQSFAEDAIGKKIIDDKIVTDGHIFTFKDGYLCGCEEKVVKYTDLAESLFGKYISGKTIIKHYEDKAQKYHRNKSDIVAEINLMAECLKVLLDDKYDVILKSSTTVNQFSSQGIYTTNFIAMAAIFTEKDITLDEFTNSTHGEYEYTSKSIEAGVEIVKIRAYGRVAKFYNGHSQMSEALNIVTKKNNETDIHNGYVYVLINPSMEGLVKIGKTTKDPKERAKELSSATGVATPFIVAYYRKFKNCDKAEKAIHHHFEAKGVRPNSSREFFEIETPEAVEVVSSLSDEI